MRTFDEIEPPLAFEPDGVVRDVTMLVPLASFERAIAAAELMSALTIESSTILDELTESEARSARAMVPSRILPVVTAPVPIVRTPVLEIVASHERATDVATLPALPTSIFPPVSEASLENAMAAEAEMSVLVIVASVMSAETTLPSTILDELTESEARSASAIVPSRILPVVTAPVPIVRTQAFVEVISPERVTAVATFDALPMRTVLSASVLVSPFT